MNTLNIVIVLLSFINGMLFFAWISYVSKKEYIRSLEEQAQHLRDIADGKCDLPVMPTYKWNDRPEATPMGDLKNLLLPKDSE